MNDLIVIENTAIRQDAVERYCLNDLHRAAGGEERHKPKYWYHPRLGRFEMKEIHD